MPEPGIANIWNLPLLSEKKFKLTNKDIELLSFGIELFDLNNKVHAIVTIKGIKDGRSIKGTDLNMIQDHVKHKLFQDLLKIYKYN